MQTAGSVPGRDVAFAGDARFSKPKTPVVPAKPATPKVGLINGARAPRK